MKQMAKRGVVILMLLSLMLCITSCSDTGTMLLNVDADIQYKTVSNDLYISPLITNYNKRTGSSVEICIYAYDADGNNVLGQGSHYTFVVQEFNLKPQEKGYTDWLILKDCAYSVSKVKIMVEKAKFADGTTRSGNDSALTFHIK